MNKNNTDNSESVLQIDKLRVEYVTEDQKVQAVREVSLKINQSETLGIIGESGCGKSTIAFAIMGYLGKQGHISNGQIWFQGERLDQKSQGEYRKYRGDKISLVYQDPYLSLNPSLKIGRQIAEVSRRHKGTNRKESWEEASSMLVELNIANPNKVMQRYPHQVSGGMQQRICIAMALLCKPSLLIMDEPTTALDATTEVVLLDMIRSLKERFDTSILYISHDLGVVKSVADRVGVMYLGRLVETAPAAMLFKNPCHPYTRGLIKSIPQPYYNKNTRRLEGIRGIISNRNKSTEACRFKDRCPNQTDACGQRPELIAIAPGHYVACHHADIDKGLDLRAARHQLSIQANTPYGTDNKTILRVQGLKKYYPGRHQVKAIDDVSFDIPSGVNLGVVGESGCGKSTLALCIEGLHDVTDGQIHLQDINITNTYDKRDPEVFRKLQMVFQNPEKSLNPSKTVAQILERPLKLLTRHTPAERRELIIEILGKVGLSAKYMNRKAKHMSGGEKQRVAIARVFCVNPEVVICDEPTSALDVSVQASVLNLLLDLQGSKNLSYLFISHDLSIVRYLCDYVAVFYLGRISEFGRTEDIFNPPYHPYTEALLSAMPLIDPNITKETIYLEGTVPSPINPPSGCRFHTRCPKKIGDICEQIEPVLVEPKPGHKIYCHIPIVEMEMQKNLFRVAGLSL